MKNILLLGAIFFLITGMASKAKLSDKELVFQMTYDGITRDYFVHVPPGYESLQSRPLVIVLHGGGGTAQGMLRLTQQRFNQLAEQNGFFVVYPQGLGKSWNEGARDSKGYARRHQINDAGFLGALIDELEKKFPIDPKRVFSTGISNGGLMSFRLACEMPEKIRAIAPVAANIPVDIVSLCREAKDPAVGLLLISGINDPIVPFHGGNIKAFGAQRGKVLSADETIEIWLKKNGCKDVPRVQEFTDKDPGDETRVMEYAYDQCSSGAPIVFYKIHGGGHTWPGGWQYLKEKRIGKTIRDIDAAEEIWKFFSSFN